ncbi:efflux RND transporter permease subunit [Fusibacter paucivorans]|uniref:Efflux RND transporter permease subunit n=1 Tax=Fusibacter paucivorans TaxID=76009 RepID=A0ABS5PT41_9FIRM|nr:efflux RND transporter permease subunit [Fusibacter paucivorans]MBS7528328.1 efflux RND transporter permease subunit [Fusibacter paucivorans]
MSNNKGIIYQTIKRKALTLAVVLFIFVLGIWSYITVPKQEYPVIQAPTVIIRAIYPGISASDMETLVTKKIEDTAMEIDNRDHISSTSLNGASIVTVSFDAKLSVDKLSTSIEDLRNKIDTLKDTDLPDGVTEVTFDTASLDTAGVILSFSSDQVSNAMLAQQAEKLKNQMVNIEGVSKIEIEGKIDERIEIDVDSQKLNHLAISLSELSNIIASQNSVLPVGSVEVGDQKVTVNTSGAVNDLSEIENIIIQYSMENGAIVRLKDIATITKTVDDEAVHYFYGDSSTVLLNVFFKEGINIVSVGPEIREAMEDYEGQLPDEIVMDTITFLPDDVGASINDFTMNLLQSIVIVLIVVMIGMSFRNGIIVSIAIPLSIFIAFIAMLLLHIDIQFISLAALIIALGMLVDNAIVISDAIQVRIDTGEEKISACINGTKEVAFPVLTSTLTTVAIFAIFFLQPGTMGIFIKSLPSIVIVSLIASYFVSILVTPLMCYFFSKESPQAKQKKSRLRDTFGKFLDFGLKHKFITIVAAFGLVALSSVVLMSLEMELLPMSDKTILDIDITTASNTDIHKTQETMEDVTALLKEVPEVESYLWSVGGRVPKYDFSASASTVSVDKGSAMIRIDLSKSERFKNKAVFAEYLQNELARKIPGNTIVVTELGIVPSLGNPVQVKLVSDDINALDDASIKIESILEGIEGAKDVTSNRMVKTNALYLDMSNDLLNPYGLSKASIQNELNIALMGRETTTYRRNAEEYPIIVKSDIDSINDLKNLRFKSSTTGSKYELKQIASVGLEPSYTSITRYDGKRVVNVGANVKPGYSADTIQNALKDQLEGMQFSDVELLYEGDSDVLGDAIGSLAIGALVGVMAIIIILMIQFNSFKQVGIIILSIPFGLIGATIGLLIFNHPISMFTMLGIISLIGVVVNNAIVLVDFINNERQNGIPIDEACREAVKKRFRPIILSTTTTVVGLIPLALPGNPLFQGMAVAFMSGLGFSVIFTLIIIPVIYAAFESMPTLRFKRKRKSAASS